MLLSISKNKFSFVVPSSWTNESCRSRLRHQKIHEVKILGRMRCASKNWSQNFRPFQSSRRENRNLRDPHIGCASEQTWALFDLIQVRKRIKNVRFFVSVSVRRAASNGKVKSSILDRTNFYFFTCACSRCQREHTTSNCEFVTSIIVGPSLFFCSSWTLNCNLSTRKVNLVLHSEFPGEGIKSWAPRRKWIQKPEILHY